MRLIRLVQLLALTVSLTSCQRKGSEVVEDTRTAGRYIGRGISSLWGNVRESRQFNSADDFHGPQDSAIGYDDSQASSSQVAFADVSGKTTYAKPTSTSDYDSYLNPSALGCESSFQNVYFETNAYFINENSDVDSMRRIEQAAQWLKSNPQANVFLAGHCDERNTAAYNQVLGLNRANMVRDILISKGINASRISTISFGKDRPAMMGSSAEVWGKNRRVEFKLSSI